MNFELFGLILEFVGTIIIAITVLRVHIRVRKERRIDKKVIRQMYREHLMTLTGIILLALGFGLNLINLLVS